MTWSWMLSGAPRRCTDRRSPPDLAGPLEQSWGPFHFLVGIGNVMLDCEQCITIRYMHTTTQEPPDVHRHHFF